MKLSEAMRWKVFRLDFPPKADKGMENLPGTTKML